MVTDLIGLGVNNGQEVEQQQQQKNEKDSLPIKSIPPNDRPMSFVQELDESAQQSDDDEDEQQQQRDEVQKKQETQSQSASNQSVAPESATTKTTITTTTVLKLPNKSPSSRSIPEEDIRKEFPNMPRKP